MLRLPPKIFYPKISVVGFVVGFWGDFCFVFFKQNPQPDKLFWKCKPLAHLIKVSFKTGDHLKVQAVLKHFTAK